MRARHPITFILLANVVLLAHAAVPHTHHGRALVALVGMLDGDLARILDHTHDPCASPSLHVAWIAREASPAGAGEGLDPGTSPVRDGGIKARPMPALGGSPPSGARPPGNVSPPAAGREKRPLPIGGTYGHGLRAPPAS